MQMSHGAFVKGSGGLRELPESIEHPKLKTKHKGPSLDLALEPPKSRTSTIVWLEARTQFAGVAQALLAGSPIRADILSDVLGWRAFACCLDWAGGTTYVQSSKR